MVVGKGASVHTDTQAEKKGIRPVKHVKEVDGLSLSVVLCFEELKKSSFAPRIPFVKSTWATGGASAENRHLPLVRTAVAQRQAKQTAEKIVKAGGGGGPYYPDFREGALVTDFLLGQCLEAVAAAFPSKTRVLFPDYVRRLVEVDHAAAAKIGNGTRASRKRSFVDGGERMKAGEHFLAPLHVKEDHWVLLECSPGVIKVYDSLRSHTNGDAVEFAKLLTAMPGFEEAVIIEDRQWPRQADGSNDCALFVMRAVLMVLSGHGQDWAVTWFSRAELDAMLPHVDRE